MKTPHLNEKKRYLNAYKYLSIVHSHYTNRPFLHLSSLALSLSFRHPQNENRPRYFHRHHFHMGEETAGGMLPADEIQSPAKHPHNPTAGRRKGGLKTMPFIISNETLEKVASVGLQANMIFYLQKQYHLTNSTGANVLFLWGALSNFTPIFGAFASDSYLGRFRVIAIGTIVTVFGMIVLWSTAVFPSARPNPCQQLTPDTKHCDSPEPAQLFLLFASFALMAVGAGGIRPCSLAFGADQFSDPADPNNERTLQTFFSWYYASVGVSVIVSALAIVAIQDRFGWIVGFGVPVVLMILSAVLFLIGSPVYVRVPGDSTLLTGFGRVVAGAWRNRGMAAPTRDSDRWIRRQGSKLVRPTDKLRFLNKACMIPNPSEAQPKDPNTLCTVQQVEELKSLIKVLPIWSTTIIIAVTVSQHSFPALQANSMDRRFIGEFKLPPASYGVFGILTLTLWVALYDRVVVPVLAGRPFNRPTGISNKYRMGIGLLISCLATAVAGAVEHRRRNLAFRGMSANWLILQYCLTGLGEAFNIIGQIEFYYSQFPENMRSIAMALVSLGLGVGNLAGSLIVSVVNERVSWVGNNLNRGHYDYYYWLLSVLSVGNFFYYLLCSWAYGSDDRKLWDEAEVAGGDGGGGEGREMETVV
ncbi:unnamed protein product [Linum tenue]|uniref:Uncharacterized protein n=1 Tax=Linum tenue TaxID=586396 RepID=A0AAV0QCQ2_9ROSI|nr:unnamed protein product [Linum tenue]